MIVIYTTKTCGPCRSLKKYLDHKGAEYTLRDIDDSPRWSDLLIKLTGARIVPVTVIGNHIIKGLDYRHLSEALNEN